MNYVIFALIFSVPAHAFTIMLEPSGHAQDAGRTIGTLFERTITYACAEAVQNHFKNNNDCTIVLSRTAHEIVQPLRNANFANRLNVDLYISIHAVQCVEEQPFLHIYRYTLNQPHISNSNTLTMLPIESAYLHNEQRTKSLANIIDTFCATCTHSKSICIAPVVGLPCVPLCGITAPAFMIEMGLRTEQDADCFASLFHEIIEQIIKQSCIV